MSDPCPDDPTASASKAFSETLYGELHRLAEAQFRRQGPAQTLQPTALLHEAWVRLDGNPAMNERDHYLSLAARVMRQVLVDHVRSRSADKRGGQRKRLTLSGASIDSDEGIDLFEMNEALRELAELDPERAQLVELRFFGGLTEQEAAGVLGVSRSDVQRKWTLARAWLARRLGDAED